jgi:hypothetical protein
MQKKLPRFADAHLGPNKHRPEYKLVTVLQPIHWNCDVSTSLVTVCANLVFRQLQQRLQPLLQLVLVCHGDNGRLGFVESKRWKTVGCVRQ